ncbi:MAG: rRNA maturation RNase YbeY [Pyrinomonadaceae bacterium]
MIEVVNRQRRVGVDEERWRQLAERVLRKIGVKDADATVAFVSDRAMRELNRRWRGRRGTTDVLSFPADQEAWEQGEGRTLGDVIISVERAAKQAEENGLTLDEEIAQLILHGLLHLCGYDHERDTGEMNALELSLRRRLGI